MSLSSQKRRPSFRPALEVLEDRSLLSPALVPNTTVLPARAVVQVFTTFPNNQTEQGTGTMVNQNTVLTAGHMVYNYSAGGWAKSIEVIAGLNGTSKPYGIAYSVSEETFNSFMADDKIDSNGHPPGDGDIGFISLNCDLGDLTGWLGGVGASGPNYNVNIYGYPGSDGYNGTQMYYYYGPLNENAPGSVTSFGYWGWSTSSMSTVPGDSGSSLILNLGGNNMGIIGVLELGPTSGPGECYAEVMTQTVVNTLESFEKSHPPTGVAGFLVQVGTQPPILAGSSFGLAIAAEDGYGNWLPFYNGTVHLSILSGPSGASLSGVNTANVVNGEAVFSNLSLSTPGSYTLLASSDEMKSVTTETITVESLTPPPNNPPIYNPPPYNPPPDNPPPYNPPTYDPPTNPPNNNPPPPYFPPSPPPPSPMQMFLDGIILAMDLSRPGGLSAALADAALLNDIDAGGGLFNPFLDAGFSAAMNVLHGNHES